MAGRSDIKAGGAYVELTLRNPLFLAGLKGAMRHLGGFTRQLFSLKSLLATLGGTAGCWADSNGPCFRLR